MPKDLQVPQVSSAPEQQSTIASRLSATFAPTSEHAVYAGHFVARAVLVGVAVHAMVTPLKTAMLWQVKPPTLPSTVRNLAILSALYRGSSISSASMNALYKGGFLKAIENRVNANLVREELEVDEVNQQQESPFSPRQLMSSVGMPYLLGFSCMDTVLRQVPETRNSLGCMGFPVVNSSYHNTAMLMKAGIGMRFGTNVLNLLGMTLLQDEIASKTASALSLEKESVTNQLLAGMLNGSVVTTVTLPLTWYRDTRLAFSKVEAGILTIPSTVGMIKLASDQVKRLGVGPAFQSVAKQLLIRAPFAITHMGCLCGIAAGAGAILGKEPPESLLNSARQTKPIETMLSGKKPSSGLQIGTGPFAGFQHGQPTLVPESVLAAVHVPSGVIHEIITPKVSSAMMQHGLFGSLLRDGEPESKPKPKV